MPQVTDMLSVLLVGRFYWSPYDGALVIVQGAVFYRLLGTLTFWYPTASQLTLPACICYGK
jgi:hypothetical protein